MSTVSRKLVFCLIGLIAGLAAWPISEIVLVFQPKFPSYLLFSSCLGMVFGGIMGGFLGSSEGITLSIRPKIASGIIAGTLIGIIGGALGFLIGQGSLLITSEMLFYSNKSFQSFGVPISRVVGWTFLGLFIGIVEGVRALSWTKIKVGVLGGSVGGLLGGVALEYLRINHSDLNVARLIGLLILGALIGLFYGLFEKGLSQGVLKLLNGKLKGKEYLLVQKTIKIGTSGKADIQLLGYTDVGEIHAGLKLKKSEIYLSRLDPKKRVLVNENRITEHQLKFEDVVQIGSAKFLFFYK